MELVKVALQIVLGKLVEAMDEVEVVEVVLLDRFVTLLDNVL